jgi:predicted small metal-binding protein
MPRPSPEADAMPFMFSCSDIDPDCPANFISDSDIELLDQIHQHVAEEHPELAQNKAATDQIKKAIKPAPKTKA